MCLGDGIDASIKFKYAGRKQRMNLSDGANAMVQKLLTHTSVHLESYIGTAKDAAHF